jgi:hypothetical protein
MEPLSSRGHMRHNIFCGHYFFQLFSIAYCFSFARKNGPYFCVHYSVNWRWILGSVSSNIKCGNFVLSRHFLGVEGGKPVWSNVFRKSGGEIDHSRTPTFVDNITQASGRDIHASRSEASNFRFAVILSCWYFLTPQTEFSVVRESRCVRLSLSVLKHRSTSEVESTVHVTWRLWSYFVVCSCLLRVFIHVWFWKVRGMRRGLWWEG